MLFRLVTLLLLALSLGSAAHVLPEPPCVEQCADDDEHGDCAPSCTDCTCCNHVRLGLSSAGADVGSPFGGRCPPPGLEQGPCEGAGREIFTVPKRSV